LLYCSLWLANGTADGGSKGGGDQGAHTYTGRRPFQSWGVRPGISEAVSLSENGKALLKLYEKFVCARRRRKGKAEVM